MQALRLEYGSIPASVAARIRQRWRLLTLCAVLLAYGISFLVCTKVFQGIRAISAGGGSSRPVVIDRRELIYFSADLERNQIGKVVFYPIIKPLELLGWAEVLDDARGMGGFECSLVCWLTR